MRNRQQFLAMTGCSTILLFTALTGLAGEKSRLVTNLEAGRKQIVVTYGTSLTEGGAWVGQLAEELNRQSPGLATVINSGQSGMWSKWGVDNLDARIIAKHPDTVFIEFSINDAYLPYATTVAQARTNLEAMTDRILAANKSCEIILMVMNPPTGGHLESRPKIEDYNQMYRDVASQRHFTLIDHYPIWQKILNDDSKLFTQYVPDGLHPGAEGCKMVILPNIVSVLGMAAKPESAAAAVKPPAAP